MFVKNRAHFLQKCLDIQINVKSVFNINKMFHVNVLSCNCINSIMYLVQNLTFYRNCEIVLKNYNICWKLKH